MILPVLAGFMALAPNPTTKPRVEELAVIVRQTLVISGMQGKALADAMDLEHPHLSRQLKTGVNLARLVNAGVAFWRHFLPLLTDMVGLARAEVLVIFGAESEDDREAERLERERDRKRIEDLERQMQELLERLPPLPAKDEQRVA